MAIERDLRVYLRDMLDAAEKARSFVAGMDYDAFASDAKTVFAAIQTELNCQGVVVLLAARTAQLLLEPLGKEYLEQGLVRYTSLVRETFEFCEHHGRQP